jgi:hypothetical protein
VLVVSAVSVAGAGVAYADEAQAEALLKEGKKLMGGGKLADACPKLEESQKLNPKSSTLLEVAICHEKQGKIATAWSEYIDVEGQARKEGRGKLEGDARARSKKLDPKLPRITITVPKDAAVAGLEVTIDGASIDKGDWGKSRPLDPGDHKLTAAAPGRKTWEQTITVRVAEKRSVSVPALAEDKSGGASTAAAATTSTGPVATATTTSAPPPPPPPDEKPEEPEGPSEHKSSGFVVEASALGGFLAGFITETSLSGLETYDYTYNLRDGVYVDLCEDKCYGVFDPAVSAYVGGGLFAGVALSDTFHLGARAHGGVNVLGGFTLVGGPAISMKLSSPLWIGGSLLVGWIQHTAPVVGLRGEVPAEAVQYNNNEDEVDVKRKADTPAESQAGTLSFGLSADISYMLLDNPSPGAMSGALMLSAWPMFLKGLSGFSVAVPVGVSYRFY